jgi:hypothetical protein
LTFHVQKRVVYVVVVVAAVAVVVEPFYALHPKIVFDFLGTKRMAMNFVFVIYFERVQLRVVEFPFARFAVSGVAAVVTAV